MCHMNRFFLVNHKHDIQCSTIPKQMNLMNRFFLVNQKHKIHLFGNWTTLDTLHFFASLKRTGSYESAAPESDYNGCIICFWLSIKYWLVIQYKNYIFLIQYKILIHKSYSFRNWTTLDASYVFNSLKEPVHKSRSFGNLTTLDAPYEFDSLKWSCS